MSDELTGELLAELREVRAELRALRGEPRRDYLFGSLWRDYAEAMKDRKWFVHSVSLMKPAVEAFGKSMVGTLRKADWYAFLDRYRQSETRDGKPPSVGTCNALLMRTKAMLNWGVHRELVSANPWRDVKKVPGQRARETEIPTEDLDAALGEGGLLACVFLVVYFEAGMRASEIRTMHWSDIDFRHRRIRVWSDRTKTREGRQVPLSETAAEWLEKLPRHVTSPYVFVNPKTASQENPDGKPYTKQHIWSLTQPILRCLKAAPGDGNVHAHDARHSLVSRLHRAGMSLFSAMKIVGHRSPATHWKYHHVSDVDRAEAKRILDGQRKGPRLAEQVREDKPGAVDVIR